MAKAAQAPAATPETPPPPPVTPTAKWVSTPDGPRVEKTDAKGTRLLTGAEVVKERDDEINALYFEGFVPQRDAVIAAHAFAFDLTVNGPPTDLEGTPS